MIRKLPSPPLDYGVAPGWSPAPSAEDDNPNPPPNAKHRFLARPAPVSGNAGFLFVSLPVFRGANRLIRRLTFEKRFS
jgi:hypothetical protein